MKYIAAILLTFSFSTFARSGKEIWVNSNMTARIYLLQEYKAFFRELQREENFDELTVRRQLLNMLLSEAWATESLDCFYAGWPSKRINGSCTSPRKGNPDYKSGSCGSNQLQCQPLLFGKNVCVSTATPKERSSAFSNCEKASKTSPEALIREVRADGNERGLFDLMDLADKICTEGAQKGTGMCNRLTLAVNNLRHFKKENPESATFPQTVESRSPAVSNKVKIKKEASDQNDKKIDQQELVQTVATAEIAMNKLYAKECEPVQVGEAFDREDPRPVVFDSATNRPGAGEGWNDSFVRSKGDPDWRYTGFEISNVGPNEIAGEAIDPNEKSERKWRFLSEDNSRRETYLWITDDAGSGYISGLMESVILLVPRKMKPKVENVGNDLHLTLTTGEKVIYDKNTKIIKAGALREGKIDANPNKQARKFAAVSYLGTGISIRVDRRGEDPRLIHGNAVVTQGGKTCQVPARELWNQQADFRYTDDRQLVNFLNKKCGQKFGL